MKGVVPLPLWLHVCEVLKPSNRSKAPFSEQTTRFSHRRCLHSSYCVVQAGPTRLRIPAQKGPRGLVGAGGPGPAR